MILAEQHKINRSVKTKDLFRKIDGYCYSVKNLFNSVNYLIRQSYRIHNKLKDGKALEDWEQELADRVNNGIQRYNNSRSGKKELKHLDSDNGFIADAYFLSWFLKDTQEYKAVPYATCSQICIQEKCREWKSFYNAVKEYNRSPNKFKGHPHAPGYLDPQKGRGQLVITNQNFKVRDHGEVIMPKFLEGIRIHARHDPVRQIRIKICSSSILITLLYEKKEPVYRSAGTVMGIDLGINNLIAAAWDSEREPIIINGRPVKSINRYFNKKRARLQKEAKKGNGRYMSKRIERLTARRNRKIKDYMHKSSRRIVNLAVSSGVGLIVIGANNGWKQNVDLGNITNQNFVSIPYNALINMIEYKARLEGIEVRTVCENYTSGTSYLDGEDPTVKFYNKQRRITRGLFKSNSGICINADVNAAYQMIKVGRVTELKVKQREQITRLQVA